jgi:hypothetical protein
MTPLALQALSYKANKEAVEKSLRSKADKSELLLRSDVVSRQDWDKMTTVCLHCSFATLYVLLSVRMFD